MNRGWRWDTNGVDEWFWSTDATFKCQPASSLKSALWPKKMIHMQAACRWGVTRRSSDYTFSDVTLPYSSQTLTVMFYSWQSMLRSGFWFCVIGTKLPAGQRFYFFPFCVYWPQTARGHFPPLGKKRWYNVDKHWNRLTSICIIVNPDFSAKHAAFHYCHLTLRSGLTRVPHQHSLVGVLFFWLDRQIAPRAASPATPRQVLWKRLTPSPLPTRGSCMTLSVPEQSAVLGGGI